MISIFQTDFSKTLSSYVITDIAMINWIE